MRLYITILIVAILFVSVTTYFITTVATPIELNTQPCDIAGVVEGTNLSDENLFACGYYHYN